MCGDSGRLSPLTKEGSVSTTPAASCGKTLRCAHNTLLRSSLKRVEEAGKALLKARGIQLSARAPCLAYTRP